MIQLRVWYSSVGWQRLTVVVKKLFDQVYVSQDHSTTAVSLEVKLCQSFTFGATVKKESQVGVPFVTNHLAAGETTDRDDHCDGRIYRDALDESGKDGRSLVD